MVYANRFGIGNPWQFRGVISGMPWSNFSFSVTGVLLVRDAWAESTDKYAATHTHTLVSLLACLYDFLSVSLSV